MPESPPPAPPVDTPPTESSTPRTDKRYLLRLGLRTLATFVVVLASLLALAGLQRLGLLSAGLGGSAESGDTRTHTCPMHPQIRQTGPGRCPICGMPLEPVTGGAADLDEYAVKIAPAARRLANIETAEARLLPVFRNVETVGSIAVDESREATIAAYVDGRIERIYADYTGVQVDEGDHLAVLYSPELYAAQVEFVEARKSLERMTAGTLPIVRETQTKLVTSARERLVELGMTDEQMAELEASGKARSRLTIFSPMGGTVTEKRVDAGKYVKAGEPIYRIADLSMVWLMLELFPEDAARVRFGQTVGAELESLPGETFTGRVGFVDRVVDERTRTVGVRVELVNEDGRLRPGDFASARIRVPIGERGEVYDAALAGKWISPMHPQIIRDEPGPCPICGMDLVPTRRYGYSDQPVERPTALVVPREAVLSAGDNSVLYVETEPGRFEIRPVTLGPYARVDEEGGTTGEVAVVLGNLKSGERVATSGNFLIDSQMQLAGKPSLIDPTRAIARPLEKPGPLDSPHIHVTPIAGDAGTHLEELYATYFEVQAKLAGDTAVDETLAGRLRSAAESFAAAEGVDAEDAERARTIAAKGEHLHHRDLDGAREDFKAISHAIVRLAFHARGSEADGSFTHFYCPMVKGGGGDWLQTGEGPLANPYFGSKMLRCGDLVRELPTEGHVAGPNGDGEEDEGKPSDAADGEEDRP